MDSRLLFRSDQPDWWNNAYLKLSQDELYRYAEGYKRSAEIIISHIKKNNKDQDFVVFPVLFLYRHYIELKLKEIIKKGRQLCDDEISYPSHHKIDKLWNICKVIITKIWPKCDLSDLSKIEGYIMIFSHYDNNSLSFRYPETKDGELSIKDLELVNLRHIKEIMEELSSTLDGIGIQLAEYLDYKNQIGNNNHIVHEHQ